MLQEQQHLTVQHLDAPVLIRHLAKRNADKSSTHRSDSADLEPLEFVASCCVLRATFGITLALVIVRRHKQFVVGDVDVRCKRLAVVDSHQHKIVHRLLFDTIALLLDRVARFPDVHQDLH